MNLIHYIGLDVHKKTISFCIKTADGRIVQEGKLQALRATLRSWAEDLREPWHGAMEATLFSAWIYDTLKPYAQRLLMGHPARMKAISAGKKKSDTIDARTIADLLRCDLLPTCYVLSPEMRDLRRLLRYRNMVVQQSVRMQNKMAGLLMKTGTPFVKDKTAREEILLRADEEPGRGTGVSKRSPADESRFDGDVRVGSEAARSKAAVRAGFGATRRTPDAHPRNRTDYSVDLGTGGRRSTSLLLDWECGQLLWLNLCFSIVCRQRATRPNLETEKRPASDIQPRYIYGGFPCPGFPGVMPFCSFSNICELSRV